jgi:hypothetical protein
VGGGGESGGSSCLRLVCVTTSLVSYDARLSLAIALRMCSLSDNVVLMCSRAGLCYYTDPNNLGVQKTLNFDGGSLHVVKGQECNELIVKCHERTLYLRASSQWEAAQVKTVGVKIRAM